MKLEKLEVPEEEKLLRCESKARVMSTPASLTYFTGIFDVLEQRANTSVEEIHRARRRFLGSMGRKSEGSEGGAAGRPAVVRRGSGLA